MLNKFLIPAALVATVVIAGIFAFMPIEKASTVHGSLATSASQTTTDTNVDNELDAKDTFLNAAVNMTRDGFKGAVTILTAESGKTYSFSYVLSATPNNMTTKGGMGATPRLECGLIDDSGNKLSGAATGGNATAGKPANGTFTLVAGRELAIQISRAGGDPLGSNVGGICDVTLHIDSIIGETVPDG